MSSICSDEKISIILEAKAKNTVPEQYLERWRRDLAKANAQHFHTKYMALCQSCELAVSGVMEPCDLLIV